MLEPEQLTFTPDTLLEHVREKAAHSAAFVFPILDEAGVLVGILAKSNLLKRAQRELILVDHNELSQAVKGADKVRIVEILDHHRIGGFATDSPILFWNNPVGSTSTIVALCYQQAGVPVPRAMAGLLMAGLLSDTLNLNSPTATETDRLVLEQLSKIVGIDPAQFAEEIFSVGSPLLTLTPEQVITADCKEYDEDGIRFTVSQIEELSFSHFAEKQDALPRRARTAHPQGRAVLCRAARDGYQHSDVGPALSRSAGVFASDRFPCARAAHVGAGRRGLAQEAAAALPAAMSRGFAAGLGFPRERRRRTQSRMGSFTNSLRKPESWRN